MVVEPGPDANRHWPAQIAASWSLRFAPGQELLQAQVQPPRLDLRATRVQRPDWPRLHPASEQILCHPFARWHRSKSAPAWNTNRFPPIHWNCLAFVLFAKQQKRAPPESYG